ncbi:MAG TPA: hypothetical protein VJS68_02600 [Thermoplasmata archaeon]|nr:hypothetical protein [Thermoplasmata archaeon]
MGWRVAVSITSVFGWLSFLLLFWAFWAGMFSSWQTVAVLSVSLLTFVAVNGAAWGSWGVRVSPSAGL